MNHINKTYTVPWRTMSPDHWAALEQVYRSLPNFIGYTPDKCPLWFGADPIDDTSPSTPFLCASVEPGGLQVSGYLSDEQWTEWDAVFMDRASRALGCAIHDAED
jgi:hypothetical protein